MAEDISKNTIIILVVLTVVISLLGTWTVLNEVNNINISSPEKMKEGSTSGQITLTIMKPPEETDTLGRIMLSKTQ